MSRLPSVLIGLAALVVVSACFRHSEPGIPRPDDGPPTARTAEVVEDHFGLEVADPYRWMEGNDNPELVAWLRAQGAYTDSYLAKIPGRDKMFRRVRALGLGASRVSGLQLAGGRAFYLALAAGEQLPKLCVRSSDGKERILIDPATKSTPGTHASINSFAPTPDGKLLAYDLSTGGSEISAIDHFVEASIGSAN